MKKRLPYIILIIGTLGLIGSLSYLFKHSPENTGSEISQESIDTEREEIAVNKQKSVSTPINKGGQGGINITMPGLFFNEAFNALGTEIQKKEKITINYHSIDHPNEYKQYIQDNIIGTGFDIFLIPLDWLESLENAKQIKKILLSEDIINYVHPLFSEYLQTTENKKNYTLIPHAIDPLVTFIAKESNLETNNRTMGKTLSYLTIADTQKALNLPILRGISKNDIRLLEQNKGSFPNYFSILYNLLYQFEQNKDIKSLDAMLQLSSFDSENKRDYVKLIQIVKLIQKRNQYCEIYPDICLFAYKFSDIKFGYLSDLNIRNHYFNDSNRQFQDINITNFPLSSHDYKIRGWAFVVNANADGNKNDEINTFFNYYLKAGVSNNHALWDNVRSAHNAIFDFQKSQKKYQNILKYEKNFSLIYAGREGQKDFLSKTQTIPLLKSEITSKEYLDGLDWER